MFFLILFGAWYIIIFFSDLLPLFKLKKYWLFAINMIFLAITCALQFSILLELKFPTMTALMLRGFDFLFLTK